MTAGLAGIMLQRAPAQNAIAANALGVLVALPFCFFASVLLGERRPVPSTPAQIYPIIYLAVMGSVVAFVTFAWLVNKWGMSRVGFLGVVVPVIAVCLGVLIRHETFSDGSMAGAVVVLIGVAAALRPERRGVAASGTDHIIRELSENGSCS